MNKKKLLSLCSCLAGMGLILFSNHVQIQVEEGKIKIQKAQRQVNKTQGFLSLDPLAKQFGKAIASGAQSQIDQGREEIEKYETIAGRIQLVGVLLIIGGIVLFFVANKKRFLH